MLWPKFWLRQPTTTEFCLDALTDWAVRTWVHLAHSIFNNSDMSAIYIYIYTHTHIVQGYQPRPVYLSLTKTWDFCKFFYTKKTLVLKLTSLWKFVPWQLYTTAPMLQSNIKHELLTMKKGWKKMHYSLDTVIK